MATEKALRAAAKELNDVLGVSPAINVKAGIDELTEKMLEAIALIDPAQDSFTDATQAVIDDLTAEPEEAAAVEEKPVRKPKPAPKEEGAEAKEKKGAPKKAGEPGKPGIIATISTLIEESGKKGVTKAEILAELVERFPDRSEESMKNTVNVQVPARINKEKWPVKKLEGDRYAKA